MRVRNYWLAGEAVALGGLSGLAEAVEADSSEDIVHVEDPPATVVWALYQWLALIR